MRKGRFYGRNFDWVFNEQSEFIVHTPSKCGRYATLGTASAVGSLTDAFVASRGFSEEYRFLPFKIVDGINEKGLVMNSNVVPSGDKGYNMVVLPQGEHLETLNARMVMRFVLDRFATAAEAIEYLRQHVEIHHPKELVEDSGYELHYMLADGEGTWILEFINGRLKATRVGDGCTHPAVMTNFHVHDTRLNTGEELARVGMLYTPGSSTTEIVPSRANKVTPHSAGLERYNILAKALADAEESFEGVQDAMLLARYGLAFDIHDPNPWYTEFVGYPVDATLKVNTTVDSPPADFSFSMGISA